MFPINLVGSVSILEKQKLQFKATERKSVVCTASIHLNILPEQESVSETSLPVTHVLCLVSPCGEA